jgi:hypothetical protein
MDCHGADGVAGIDGATGLTCWDLNGNGLGDPAEDIDGDGLYTVMDCRGAAGPDGQDGIDGTNGTDGRSCWDLNGDGIGEPREDIDGDGLYTAADCRGDDGLEGLSCWDLNANRIGDLDEDLNGDGFFTATDCRGAEGTDGANGVDGVDGQDCWDLNGNGIGDPDEDLNGDLVVDIFDCRGADGETGLPGPSYFDSFIDDFFTVHNGSYGSLPLGTTTLPVVEIEEPALGPAEVIAYRTVIPQFYDDYGFDNPAVDQNTVTMRMFFWREGPQEDCFVVRLDAFRARHGTGILRYGSEQYIKLNDPAEPDPLGTLVVVDLPLNNADDDPAWGLGFPADLQVGDFLAFELNLLPDSTINREVSYTLLGVEFFETPPNEMIVDHATVFHSFDDVDCQFYVECSNDHDCDDGEFCNGEETCNADGSCEPGIPACDIGTMCDEVDDVCVSCDTEIAEGKRVICHFPPGAPQNARTLVIGESAVAAHMAHGDWLGACETNCGL